jgi:Bifunctional DNA primase/polymerase, N-terminal
MLRCNGPGALAGATEAGGYRVFADTRTITTLAHPLQTAVDAALDYARRGWPVFPCQWQGERRKRPLVAHGLHTASRDEAQIRNWWRRWPHALIGIPTGRAIGAVVLDIDLREDTYGLDTLADLGLAILPDTPMVHTASGGLHLYFEVPQRPEIHNTSGERGSGIGAGLDGAEKAVTSSPHRRTAAIAGIYTGAPILRRWHRSRPYCCRATRLDRQRPAGH